MQSEAANYWQDWIEGTRDVPSLRLHTISLFMRMREAAQDDDWQRFNRLLETYSFGEEYCRDEPQLSVFENGLMYVHTELADCMWLKGDLEQAMDHVRWVGQTLKLGDARREESGMVARPNSELRYLSIGIKSACCLEDPYLFETKSPELETSIMASEFWRLADSSIAYLKEKVDVDSERFQTILYGLARWELELCKLCERFNPAFLEIAIDFFNTRIGHHLEASHKHFLELDSRDDRSAWYWDFELSKMETSGECDRAEVLLCSTQRSASARLMYTKGPSVALQRPWKRQVDRMLAKVKND